MTQSTARTGPSGLVRPDSLPAPTSVNGDLEAAIHQIRVIARRPAPGPISPATRFSVDTALRLAEKAPELYGMDDTVKRRFDLIANFLRDAITDMDEQAQA